eukprot:2945623-Ditylum_brightwellii.AAC.1
MEDQETTIKAIVLLLVFACDNGDLGFLRVKFFTSALCFPTFLYSGIIADQGWRVSLACNKAQIISIIVMSASNQPPFYTLEGMMEAMFFATPVTDGGHIFWCDLVLQHYHITKLVFA